jgi:hypothetical protein
LTELFGADTSSTALAGDVALLIGAKHIRMVKIEDAEGKRQIWDSTNESLLDGEIILHIEELITTAFSAIQVREGIKLANPNVKINYVHIYRLSWIDRIQTTESYQWVIQKSWHYCN